MRRVLVFAFGVLNYLGFLGVAVYCMGFLGNVVVPRSIDAAAEGSRATAGVINLMLVLVFALQHTVMARPTFKQWWKRLVPEPAERSTYVLFSNLAMILLFWQWRPMGGVVWHVTATAGQVALYALFVAGWLIVLSSTFLIDHFDLFGLRQAWMYLKGKPYTHLEFKTPGPYKLVRHPLYVGWIMVFWAAPTMSVSRLVFALGMTVYILVAIRFEERNLVDYHGERYAAYRKQVPMLIPCVRGASSRTQ